MELTQVLRELEAISAKLDVLDVWMEESNRRLEEINARTNPSAPNKGGDDQAS